jgi:hypothetical protein
LIDSLKVFSQSVLVLQVLRACWPARGAALCRDTATICEIAFSVNTTTRPLLFFEPAPR